jgi:plasmanylethanolamine desaturase
MRSEQDQGWVPAGHDAYWGDATATLARAMTLRDTFGVVHGDEQDGGRPFRLVVFDVLSVSTLLALLMIATHRMVGAVAGGAAWELLVPALVAAVLCADLVSGLVHWIGDRFFDEKTPVLGAMLIRPFREHHRDPLAITRHGFFELCGNNALGVIVPVLLLVLGSGPEGGALSFCTHAFVIFFSLAVFGTNLVHKWAHARKIARPVRWLQASRLILSPELHARHHRGDFSNGYCVTTGWMNPALDALRLLPRFERVLRRAMARSLDMRSSQPS